MANFAKLNKKSESASTSNNASSFNSFNKGTDMPKNTIRITLNLKKEHSAKKTILTKTHNGTIFNTVNGASAGTSFIKFRLVGTKNGELNEANIYRFDELGRQHTMSAAQLQTMLYQAETFEETPDSQFIADLGDTSELEEAMGDESNAAGSISIDVPFNGISIADPNGEYNGNKFVLFRLNDVKVSFGATVGRKRLCPNFIAQITGASITNEVIDGNYLSQFRRVSTKATSTHSIPVASAQPIQANNEAPVSPEEVKEFKSFKKAAPKSAQEMAVESLAIDEDIDGLESGKDISAEAFFGDDMFEDEEPTPVAVAVVEEPKELPSNPGVGFGKVEETTTSTTQPDDSYDMDDDDFDNLTEAEDENSADVVARLAKASSGEFDLMNMGAYTSYDELANNPTQSNEL